MILRSSSDDAVSAEEPELDSSQSSDLAVNNAPMRWRLALITALCTSIAVGAMTVITYWTVSAALSSSADPSLTAKAESVLELTLEAEGGESAADVVEHFKQFNPDIRMSIQPENWSLSYGDTIPGGADFDASMGFPRTSIRMVGNERIVTMQDEGGATVILAKDMTSTRELISALGTVLMVITALGVLLAIVAGTVGATAGLRPLARFQREVEVITRTRQLKPIQVVGNDELAQLTMSFNEMIQALHESNLRQSQLVADAGHELKTPLTSIRTNIELIMQLSRSGVEIPEQDRKDLEEDVVAQFGEMSSLIGALVDLAREESTTDEQFGEIDLGEIVDESLERVRRRRSDVSFDVTNRSWWINGDAAGLGRAVINLLDNAVKWSPVNGVVRVDLRQIDGDRVRLTVDDAGPGIHPKDRDRIFDRFYRAAESRAMPGSGLGLAITRHVIDRHGGTITVTDSPEGGTRMVAELPGLPDGQETAGQS